MAASSKFAPIALVTGFALFLAILAYVMISAFIRPHVLEFEPSPITPRPPSGSLVVDTITVDARDAGQWQFVDLARRSVVFPPDTAGWSLALRRFDVISSGDAADLGRVAFDSVRVIPVERLTPTEFGRDTVNAAMKRWYDYSFTTHVMNPNGHVYGIRTRSRHYAKLEIISYYCPGVEGGCLTFRYAYQPSGAPSFASPPSP